MLIDLRALNRNHKLDINGILHVGAHECEELGVYRQVGLTDEKIIWVEGNPSIYERMSKYGVKNLYNALISDEEKLVDFIITNNGQSSSILELDEHKTEHPHVVEVARVQMNTQRLDNLLDKINKDIPFNFINLDIQGNELAAIKSLGKYMEQIKYIYTEVNIKHLYKDCPLLDEIDDYLKTRGFIRYDTNITTHGWGDAFYIRSK